MIAHRSPFTVTCLLSLCVLCASARDSFADIGAHRWDVETSRVAAHNIEIIRGESLHLEPRFLVARQPIDLSTVSAVELRYRTVDMTTNYYVVTGAVLVATSGTVRVTWTSAACAAADTYNYTLLVDDADGANRRAYGAITLIDSVGTSGTGSPAVASSPVDWAILTHNNAGLAPFPLDSESLAISSRVTVVETDLGVVSGRVDTVETDLGVVSGRVDQVETDLGVVSGRVDTVETDLGVVSGRVDQVETDLGTVSGRVDVVETALGVVSGRVDQVETDLGVVSGRVTVVEGYVWPQTATNDTPTAKTPRALGDTLIIHGATNILYRAFGTTTNDWEKIWP
jgi:hypothetical protein